MKRINSRAKGARGERQWRDELRANGFEARRGQQFCGSPDSPDVVCPSLPWAHWEVKCVEALNLVEAMAQAKADGAGKAPIVAHRRNFWPWLITMEADTLFGAGDGFLSGACYFARTESKRLNVHEAMRQAGRDASGRTAFLLHRRGSGAWLVTMAAETFFRLLRGDVPGISSTFAKASADKNLTFQIGGMANGTSQMANAFPNSEGPKEIFSIGPSHGAMEGQQITTERELIK